MKRFLSIWILSCLLVLPTGAQSLRECVSRAQKQNLGVRVADLETQRARRMEGSYMQMDKTELSLSQDPTAGGSPDNALTVSQGIDFPTVYTSRRRMLKAETQVQESQQVVTQAELTRDVCQAYSQLLYQQHQVQLLTQNDSVLTAFVQVAQKRFQLGETNQLEVMNAQRMLSENQLKRNAAQSAAESAQLELQALLNSDETISPTDDYLCIPTSAEGYTFQATPMGQLLQSQQILSTRQYKYERQGYMPSLNVGLRTQVLIGGINPYNIERTRFEKGNWMGFEVGLTVPLFFGSQRARTAASRMDVTLSSLRQQEAERQSDTQLAVAERALVTAEQAHQHYLQEALPQAQEMRRLSAVEYQSGEISYVEYIQNLTTALQIELDAAQSQDAVNQSRIQVNYIKGVKEL